MGNRFNKEQLELIKEKMGVEQLWSFSKVSTYDTCSWLYYLKYILKIRVKGDNCYTWWGTAGHDIIQGLYDGEHKHEEMIDKLEAKVLEYNLLTDPKLKFPSENEYVNYIANLRHYFKNVVPVPYKVINEKPVLAVFEGDEKYVFSGYLDSEYVDDDGYLVILDYKTSSMSGFTGAKLLEKSRQLMIYALGISTFGRMIDGKLQKLPLNKIKIRYDMMKYMNVSYIQKNGEEKVTKAERRLWVAKIATPLRKNLEDVGKEIEKINKDIAKLEKKIKMKKTTEEEALAYSDEIAVLLGKEAELSEYNYNVIEINEMVEEAMNSNNLDNMPKFIQDKYTLSDCYIDIELNDEIIKDFKSDLVATLNKIVELSKKENKQLAFTRGKIENSDSYYCVNLCDMKDHCDFYKSYKEHNAMFLTKDDKPSDEELLALLGL